ncbi:AraC family transcriptional regulator [Runella zeae]|uniref:AraC family transcriptional regulator n=1 Tax=Runella zeae TaxID=94255 RepID=UPI000428C8F9|nr:helix-turn-helix domain-containing protein [Runella zeae]
MRFEKIIPIDTLKPFVKYFIISENQTESEYKVFPSSGLVVGFQYRGQLFTIHNEVEHPLASAGVTGITDSYKLFKNAPHIGTILVYFTEIGFTHFAAHPAHELFNQSVSLDYIFDKNKVNETEERLSDVHSDQKRIEIIEQFLLTQLKDIQIDKLIIEAVRMIYQSKGTIKIKELNEKLAISQSPFEKRFRKIVGTSPKKFASIVRFNTVLDQLGQVKSLTEICYENNFFDQAHFIKDFRQYTGDTPEHFKRFL